MQRREFNLTAAAAAAALSGCGGGGGGDAPAAAAVGSAPAGTASSGAPVAATPPAAAPGTSGSTQAATVGGPFVIGTNLASMELGVTLRFGGGTLPNVNFTVPRRADIAWLAANGFTKTRLPIRWEMLQPMLFDTNANASVRAVVGQPGAFHPIYTSLITQVLDSHAAAGIKCMLDVHNYCRYTDFVYQADGSVIGLTASPNPLIYPFSTDPKQVQTRIMSLAPGATLRIAHYVDFMTRLAAAFKGHPGLGGYGMMNEPFFMPRPNTIVESFQGFGQDLSIWPTFAKAAIDAIRSIDPNNPIYLGGNNWNSSWTIATDNPGWPVNAANVIYDVHGYLDAFSSGNGVDWDLEAGKGFTAGVAAAPIDAQTGVARLSQAVGFTQPRGLKLSLSECGMPADDPRWQESWTNVLNFARTNGVEIFTWAGGNHWFYRNHPLNHQPGWHQNKTMDPQQAGPMKAVAGVAKATIFDDGGGFAPGGGSVTVTVYARGALAAPVTINVASSNGGSFSKTTLTIPAGANGQDSYTFTPPPNAVVTLTYSSASAPNVPPPRKVYSLADPVAFAATNLPDAARAILAKYAACKWELADGFTDYMQGAPSAETQQIRAVSDSGYGSSVGNQMEMLNWFNTDPNNGTWVPPVMRTVNGHKSGDFTNPNTFGLWCRKTVLEADLQPRTPKVVPWHINEPHFVIAAVAVPAATSGIVFQACNSDNAYTSELKIAGGKPQANWLDSAGNPVVLTSPAALAPNAPAVIAMVSRPGAQQLRVNSAVVGSGTGTFASSLFGNDQMLLGSGFITDFPRDGFGGFLFSAVTGKGNPTDAEMQVLERYLGSTAGI
jgi:endoglucanase